MKRIWNTENYRKNQSEAIRRGQNKPESRKRMSDAQVKRYSSEEAHEIMRKAMGRQEVVKKISDSNKRTKQNKKKSGYYRTEEWRKISIEQKRKEFITKKNRNNYGKSSIADDCIKMISSAGYTVEPEKEYPNEPNLHCDAYVKELDIWIEFHYGWEHQYCRFDSSNNPAIEHLNELKSRSSYSDYYKTVIYTWTNLDVRKYRNAEDNNLKYFVFYYLHDFYEWYTNNICKIQDSGRQNKGD